MKVFTMTSQQPTSWVALRSFSDNDENIDNWVEKVEWSVETDSYEFGLRVWCWKYGAPQNPGVLPLNWDIA